MAKIIVLVALAIGFGAAVALWNGLAGVLVMVACVIAAIWFGTKIIKIAQT